MPIWVFSRTLNRAAARTGVAVLDNAAEWERTIPQLNWHPWTRLVVALKDAHCEQ